MNSPSLLTCPYCGGDITAETSICPDCQEDLSSLIRLRYEHAIYYNEALAAAREEDYQRAAARAALAIERKSDFVPAYILLAKIHGRQAQWEEADRVVSRALEIAPGDADLRSFAEELMALSAAARQTNEQRASIKVHTRRESAESYLAMYERDVKRAFGLGVAVATILTLLVSWIGGRTKGQA